MTVSGISGVNAQQTPIGTGQATDSYSKNLQRQIAEAQKKLQELSQNDDLSPEDKMKKRQEINQEITNLNQQLRQHQMEVRKQAAQQRESSRENTQSENSRMKEKSGKTESGMSGAGMKAILSADASVKQAEVQGAVKNRLEGRSRVLKAEIKQDGNLGVSTASKEAELAEAEDRAASVERDQGNTLAEANKNLRESSGENKAERRAESVMGQNAEEISAKDTGRKQTADEEESRRKDGKEGEAKAERELPQGYVLIDVRL